MALSRSEFYKISSGDNKKPSAVDAQRKRERSRKILELCIACLEQIDGAGIREKKLKAKFMDGLSQSITYATSHRWADENLPLNTPILRTAKQLLDNYYSLPPQSAPTKRKTINTPNQPKKKIHPPQPPRASSSPSRQQKASQKVVIKSRQPIVVSIKKPA